MKRFLLWIFSTIAVLTVVIIIFCLNNLNKAPRFNPEATVTIRQSAQGYQLIYDKAPFISKGVAGFTYLEELKAIGGNTIRTWDTTNIRQVLDSAQMLDLKVIVGLPLPDSRYFDYSNDQAVDTMIRSVLSTVEQFKNHPAVLIWGLGNEVVFYPSSWNKLAVYQTLNKLGRLVKESDPNHPTTTMLLYSRREFMLSQLLLPNLDILSFNVFGRVHDFRDMLSYYLTSKPFLISEWGINGPWEEQQTSWGAPIENSSFIKSQQLIERYETTIPKNHPKHLGNMAFFWGHKFEVTPTWFNFFTSEDRPTHLVSSLEKIFQSPGTTHTAPPLEYILLNKKGAFQDILVSSEDTIWANAVGTLSDELIYHWEVLPESIAHQSTLEEYLQPQAVPNSILTQAGDSCQIKIPEKPGAYRLYVTVSDTLKNTTTANIPFYVIR